MNAVNDKPEITPDTNKQKLPPSGIDINLTNKSINQELLAARVAVANLLPHVDQAEKFLTIIVTNERHASKIRSSFWRSLFYPAHKIISEMDKKYAAYDELILFAVKAEIAAQLLGGITKKLTAQGYHLPGIAPEIKTYITAPNLREKLPDYADLREQALKYKTAVDAIIRKESARLAKRPAAQPPRDTAKTRRPPQPSHERI